MSEFAIRRAGPDDAATLAALYLAARRTHLPFAPLAHRDEEVRQWIAAQLIPAGRSWLIEAEPGRPLGLLSDSVDAAGMGWIDQLYLDPARVGRGLGRALLLHALQRLPRPLRLYTFQANMGARRFYERHGFVVLREGDGADNEERCPDLLMELGGDA
ncbi:GNAT family N-acetyltransferase [Roseateles sp. DAIF2]|uniref:GNAT family N-acetyltransferase n=1 Tax=Roseateles sp. DAIF2 TaxID=2714952 RepID=UPI0018A2D8A5|nr:GNAT family N-acetyltransferase [Roseateles sp. DAIF2]QPF75127.1 GNAT family N-acetyltransferase [Roseateles sp. DAIF2]